MASEKLELAHELGEISVQLMSLSKSIQKSSSDKVSDMKFEDTVNKTSQRKYLQLIENVQKKLEKIDNFVQREKTGNAHENCEAAHTFWEESLREFYAPPLNTFECMGENVTNSFLSTRLTKLLLHKGTTKYVAFLTGKGLKRYTKLSDSIYEYLNQFDKDQTAHYAELHRL